MTEAVTVVSKAVRFWCQFTQVNLDLRAVERVCFFLLLSKTNWSLKIVISIFVILLCRCQNSLYQTSNINQRGNASKTFTQNRSGKNLIFKYENASFLQVWSQREWPKTTNTLQTC